MEVHRQTLAIQQSVGKDVQQSGESEETNRELGEESVVTVLKKTEPRQATRVHITTRSSCSTVPSSSSSSAPVVTWAQVQLLFWWEWEVEL